MIASYRFQFYGGYSGGIFWHVAGGYVYGYATQRISWAEDTIDGPFWNVCGCCESAPRYSPDFILSCCPPAIRPCGPCVSIEKRYSTLCQLTARATAQCPHSNQTTLHFTHTRVNCTSHQLFYQVRWTPGRRKVGPGPYIWWRKMKPLAIGETHGGSIVANRIKK